MIEFKGQQVLVTGAATGIGAALARGLAERGARVICADIQAEVATQLAEEIGGGAVAIYCDLSRENAAQ